MTTLLETCRVSPPAAAGTGELKDLTLPLTFFDIYWLHFHPIRRTLFYDHPCSKSEFLNIIVPKLKQSLSLTLKHYLPAAGNLLYPKNSDTKPVIRYSAGDSIELKIVESSRDFDELTVNHVRDADQFYDFVPEIPPVKDDGEWKVVPLVALQATLLPGRGICLGIVNLHCLGDGRSVNAGFIYAWASINKFDGDEEVLRKNGDSLPIFDRSFVEDPLKIDTIFWKVMAEVPFKPPSSFPLPTNRVRATYTLNRSQIDKLKNRVLSRKPGLDRVSSFTVTVSYVWTCMVNSGDDGHCRNNGFELLVVPIDARERKSSLASRPVPANYFVNCLDFAVTSLQREKIASDGGFEAATEAVAEEIKKRVTNEGELLKGAENWLSEMEKSELEGTRVLGVSGSPKFDLSVADFGWGRARKMENLTIDGEKYSMSLCNGRECGELEIGLSLPKERMEAFAAIFARGLIA